MPAREELVRRLGTLLAARLGLGDGDLTEATGLLGQGVGLDSVEILQLVGAIEDDLGITIEDDDLAAEHFRTVGTLVTFVQERLG